ncbi:hypothetical protein [Nocardia lijiangensis]|uniref:hypothetical protein n=1 Tax=Nocardia lijiangensis TaxID=299618 RepID=UPI003D7554B9
MIRTLTHDFGNIGRDVLAFGHAVLDLLADLLSVADPGQGGRGGGGAQYPFG